MFSAEDMRILKAIVQERKEKEKKKNEKRERRIVKKDLLVRLNQEDENIVSMPSSILKLGLPPVKNRGCFKEIYFCFSLNWMACLTMILWKNFEQKNTRRRH